jgi:hypothetical protein
MDAAVEGCVAPADFGSHFMPRWFWEVSNAYCFIFGKNLRVTNIQIAESLACSDPMFIPSS